MEAAGGGGGFEVGHVSHPAEDGFLCELLGAADGDVGEVRTRQRDGAYFFGVAG